MKLPYKEGMNRYPFIKRLFVFCFSKLCCNLYYVSFWVINSYYMNTGSFTIFDIKMLIIYSLKICKTKSKNLQGDA